MNQCGVTLIAIYLEKRPLGRIVQVRNVGEDDYIVAVEDRRDGRTQLIHSAGDLRVWVKSFREGRCVVPATAICARCDNLHVDRAADSELLGNCTIACAAELITVGAEILLQDRP